jgi:diguanylate cyclase (GGDEF)-like protein
MRAPGPDIGLGPEALDRLMPLHLACDARGHVVSVGPTLAKLSGRRRLIGAQVQEILALRRPAAPATVEALRLRAGTLALALATDPAVTFRGLAVPSAGGGLFLNLSFGIGVTEAVRRHSLTVEDFAATDLTVEMLYLVEAKSAVMDELRSLNQRLQGAREAAEERALTDQLTGLRNRRALDLQMKALIGQGMVFGLMHIDLDFFKQVNDTHGHAAGDHVLREVARVLREETRASDLAARVGGDEFVLVFPGLADAARLIRIARRIIARLSRPIDYEGRACRISASIGVTLSAYYDRPEAERMLFDADAALYASKRAGRAQVQLFARPDGEPDGDLAGRDIA